jgi:hypothetical protein
MDKQITFTGRHIGAPILFRVAKKNACERLSNAESSTFGGKDDALVAIIFSAVSIEAFFNAICHVRIATRCCCLAVVFCACAYLCR